VPQDKKRRASKEKETRHEHQMRFDFLLPAEKKYEKMLYLLEKN
jgi:hypothetical protein